MVLLNTFVAFVWVISYFIDYRQGRLKFRVWLPYDYSSPVPFLLSTVHQITVTLYSVNMNIICDCLLSGFLIHIYSQLEILGHRMRNIAVNKSYSAKSAARHHYRIYKLV